MHGIILHEEYRARMKKLGPERVGQIVFNLFRIDDGEEPISFPDDEALDTASEFICGRFKRDIEASDRGSHNGSKGGAPKGNQNARKQPKNNPKTTQKQPKNKQETSENKLLLPITNNQLPITNDNDYIVGQDLFVDDVISYLNYKAGTHYRVTDKSSKLINARVKEGFTTDDFKKVIDKKVKSWKGTPYEKFIRPSTLFAPSHFEEYLNEPDGSSDDMFSAFLEGDHNDESGVYTDSQDFESGVFRPEVYSE